MRQLNLQGLRPRIEKEKTKGRKPFLVARGPIPAEMQDVDYVPSPQLAR